MAERVQHYICSVYVVAHCVSPPANAPLPFTWFHASQFLDRMLIAAIVRILPEYFEQFLESADECRISLTDSLKFTLEGGVERTRNAPAISQSLLHFSH